MKPILVWGLVTAFALFVCKVYGIYLIDPPTATFLVQCALSIGTITAVLFALFGDYLRATLDPIRIRIEVLKDEENNNDVDKITIENDKKEKWERYIYCHHLRVRNLTPHKPITNSRVWLRRISIKGIGGAPEVPLRFAVPRLMEWAPSEYSRDKRTFCKQQVFDLGQTFVEKSNEGFSITIDRRQHAAKNRLKDPIKAGTHFTCALFVTADNYLKEREFEFDITVPAALNGQPQRATIIPRTSFLRNLQDMMF